MTRMRSSRRLASRVRCGPTVAARPARSTARPRDEEGGQITLLVVGLTAVAILLIMVTLAVTSAHLTRMRLLDAADGAALDAADSLSTTAYERGIGAAVTLTDAAVTQAAVSYLGERPRPSNVTSWQVDPGTGAPDGQTAVVELSGTANVPVFGAVLQAAGGEITIHVRSVARAGVQ